jgi:hypothetical protein
MALLPTWTPKPDTPGPPHPGHVHLATCLLQLCSLSLRGSHGSSPSSRPQTQGDDHENPGLFPHLCIAIGFVFLLGDCHSITSWFQISCRLPLPTCPMCHPVTARGPSLLNRHLPTML